MQTITIAVSAILIAAGLVTAPGLINNARDNNARGDLANIAYTEEFVLSSTGDYSDKVLPGIPGSIADGDPDSPTGGKMKYTLSGGVIGVQAIVCDDPDDAYLIKAESTSGKTWFRASGRAVTSSNLADLEIADCIKDDPFYNDFDPDPTSIEFDAELTMTQNAMPVGDASNSFYWNKNGNFTEEELNTVDDIIAAFDTDYGVNGGWAGTTADYQYRNWSAVSITTSKAYNANGSEIGSVQWGDDENPTGFDLNAVHYETQPGTPGDGQFNLGSGYLSTFSSWENYYSFYNGGFVIIETTSGYKVKINIEGTQLVNPADVVNESALITLYGAWNMDSAVYPEFGTFENMFTHTMFESDAYTQMQRPIDTIADFYYSPTGNEGDFVLDAEDVAVSAGNSSNSFTLLEEYTYAEDIENYREDDGNGGKQGRGAWRVVIAYLGGALTYETDPNNHPYSWEPPVSVAPSILTAELPNGFTETYYNGDIEVEGSPRPEVELVSGTLPPGTEIQAGYWNSLSGTPTEIGTFTFTVKAVNASGESAPVTYTVEIHGWTYETPLITSSHNTWHNPTWNARQQTSENGQNIFVIENGTAIYRSSNGGTSFSKILDVDGAFDINVSPNGTYVLYWTEDGGVSTAHISTDGGYNWSTSSGISTPSGWNLNGTAISNLGYVYVGAANFNPSATGDINKTYRSTDYGFTWAEVDIATDAYAVSFVSNNGTFAIAHGDTGEYYWSMTNGLSWSQITNWVDYGRALDRPELFVMSGDGMTWAYENGYGEVYVSDNFGGTWNQVWSGSTVYNIQLNNAGSLIQLDTAGSGNYLVNSYEISGTGTLTFEARGRGRTSPIPYLSYQTVMLENGNFLFRNGNESTYLTTGDPGIFTIATYH